ncbi:hypothetical protein [Aerosakkonema funiforme]|uniref:Uncharacterized protein n=1 Tax=Aerosakkonema funiforme FACHB-1375 TaxID=2949571 RepID=A0A926VKR4_9CYAN|nr:hypothetical protein [Aerosakkonema funiforme]MBD2185717.1 hypothetical protein [Aerosakkonema funiforme FACHB-1375]
MCKNSVKIGKFWHLVLPEGHTEPERKYAGNRQMLHISSVADDRTFGTSVAATTLSGDRSPVK